MNAAGSAKRPPLAIPGRLYVAPTDPAVVELDVAAGWMAPRGILGWTREVSVVSKAEVSDAVRRELSLALPHEHISVVKHPTARRAAQANPVAAVSSALGATLSSRGVRVHTIGYDKVTANFFYFAEGGTTPPVRIQGDLLEMIAPVLAYGNENDDIARHLARLIDRIVAALSGGALTELRVELADALPPLAGKGSITPDLDTFEKEAIALTAESARWRGGAESLASTLESAGSRKEPRVPVHLFGEATRVTRTAMDLDVGGTRIALPSRTLWVVSGEISDKPPVSAPPPPAAEVDEAWGEEAPAAAKPAEKPAEAKPAAAAKPTEAKPTTPKQPEVRPAEAKPTTPKPAEAKPTTPKQPEAKPVTPKQPETKPTTPRQPDVKRPTPAVGTPRPAVASPSPRPAVVSAPEVTPAVTPIVAQRTVSLGTPLPRPVVAAAAETPPPKIDVPAEVVAVAAPIAASAPNDRDDHDDEDDADESDNEAEVAAAPTGKEDRAAKQAAKLSAKAAKKAAKRAAAKEANRVANAPKGKKKGEARSEPKVAAAADVAADKPASVKPAAAITKKKSTPAPPIEEDEALPPPPSKKRSANMFPIIAAIAIIVAFAIFYFLKIKK